MRSAAPGNKQLRISRSLPCSRLTHALAVDVEAVASQPNGEIDYGALADALSRNGLTRPAILNLNIGSTVKGAVDDIDRVLTILARCGYAPDRFYIHCDGALFGSSACRPPLVHTALADSKTNRCCLLSMHPAAGGATARSLSKSRSGQFAFRGTSSWVLPVRVVSR